MRKYPSQEDAQLLIDIMNDKGVYTGACSPEFRKAGEKFNATPPNWTNLIKKTFGFKSPWSYRTKFSRNPNGKFELYWDKDKASSLGI